MNAPFLSDVSVLMRERAEPIGLPRNGRRELLSRNEERSEPGESSGAIK